MKIDSEYHTIAGDNIVETNAEYKEYRRKWHEYPQQYKVADFPLFLDIDITDICNLKCSFCLRQSNPELIQNKKMSFNIFKKIIDEGARYKLYGCKLNIIGEPLIHPKVFDMIKYAKKKGLIDVYFNTNGYFLNDENARKLIDSGIDRISLSVDGYTKSMYEKHRVGSSFKKVVSNVKNLRRLKKIMNIDYPKVRIQTVLLPKIKIKLRQYIDFWKPMCDEIGFLDYQPRVEKSKTLKSKWYCSQIWQRIGILVDGTIIPCNHDERKIMSLGNIRDTTIYDAWHSLNLHVMRLYHKTGYSHSVPSCKICYLRESEILKERKNDSSS
jgi:radical SAM protein with 4Fe4S-binding SPASM domain